MDLQEIAAQNQETFISTPSSDNPEEDIQEQINEGLLDPKPEFLFKISSEHDDLIIMLPNGDIVADSIEKASEAGRVFIESMTMHGKPLVQKIQELEEENELLKQKIKTYEVH